MTDRHGRGPRAAGILARIAYGYAAEAGIRLGPLLRRAGLTREQVQEGAAPIRVRDQIEFVNLLATALGDDLLGFLVRRRAGVGDFGAASIGGFK